MDILPYRYMGLFEGAEAKCLHVLNHNDESLPDFSVIYVGDSSYVLWKDINSTFILCTSKYKILKIIVTLISC